MARSTQRPEVPTGLQPAQDLAAQIARAARDPNLEPAELRASHLQYLRQLWQYREFALTVPLGQLEARNQDKLLGRLWYLLNPMILVFIYYLVFQVILGVEARRGVEDYLPFLTAGVIAYTYTRGCANAGSASVRRGRRMVQSMRFPRAILPLGSTIAQTWTFLWAIGAMLGLVLIMGVSPTWRWAALPVVLLVHGIMNLGLALFAARFTFEFPDFGNLLPFLLRLGIYVSGVLIPINADVVENDQLRFWLQVNPVFHAIDLWRQTVLGTPFRPVVWIAGPAWALVLLVGGFLYFRRAEHRYASV